MTKPRNCKEDHTAETNGGIIGLQRNATSSLNFRPTSLSIWLQTAPAALWPQISGGFVLFLWISSLFFHFLAFSSLRLSSHISSKPIALREKCAINGRWLAAGPTRVDPWTGRGRELLNEWSSSETLLCCLGSWCKPPLAFWNSEVQNKETKWHPDSNV